LYVPATTVITSFISFDAEISTAERSSSSVDTVTSFTTTSSDALIDVEMRVVIKRTLDKERYVMETSDYGER
jgi:hypothetical protein